MGWFTSRKQQKPEAWQEIVADGLDRVEFTSPEFERRKSGICAEYEQELLDYYGWSRETDTIREHEKQGWMFTNNFLLWIHTEGNHYREMMKEHYPKVDNLLGWVEVGEPELWSDTVSAIETHWTLTDPYCGVAGKEFVASPDHHAVMDASKHNKTTLTSRMFDIIAPQVVELGIDIKVIHA